MRHVRSVLAPLLVLVLAGSVAADNRNAATWYRRAFEGNALTETDRAVINQYRQDPGAGPPPGLREAVSKASRAIDLARRGARESYADYDLDYSKGFEMELPHLHQLRQLGRAMEADMLLHLHDGDAAGAAWRAASMYRMAEHLRGDRTLISSLVGHAMFAASDATVQAGIDRGAFSAHDADVMLRGLRPLDAPDPFDMLEAVVVGEQELVVHWMHERLATQADRERITDEFRWLTDDPEVVDRFVAMSDAAFLEAVDQYDRMMDDVVVAFGRDDVEAGAAELAEILVLAEAGEHGLVAMLVAPNLVKVHARMVDARAKVHARLEMLEGLATGAIRPEEEINAALLYARGIAALRRLEPSRLDAVIAFAAGGAEDETLAKTLADAGEAVDLFREGSQKRRCDFTVLRANSELPLCPDDVAGLHDALRTLQADARHALAAGSPATAVDRLGIAYRVIGHLAGDTSIMSALVAHAAFDRVDAITRAELGSGVLDAGARRALLHGAERIRRTDPFGYLGSITDTRERLGQELARPRSADERDDPARAHRVRATVGGWDGDELLFVLAVRGAIARAGDGETAPEDAVRHRLDDLLPPDALAAVRDRAPLVELALARGEIDLFRDGAAPPLASVEARRRAARADLRRGLALLRPHRQPAAAPATPGSAGTPPD